MNHNADIEDGLEEFNAEKERLAAEQEYLASPEVFDQLNETNFHGAKMLNVVLVGRRTKDTGHPFDFENGTVSIQGDADGVPQVLNLRWSDNGATVDRSYTAKPC